MTLLPFAELAVLGAIRRRLSCLLQTASEVSVTFHATTLLCSVAEIGGIAMGVAWATGFTKTALALFVFYPALITYAAVVLFDAVCDGTFRLF